MRVQVTAVRGVAYRRAGFARHPPQLFRVSPIGIRGVIAADSIQFDPESAHNGFHTTVYREVFSVKGVAARRSFPNRPGRGHVTNGVENPPQLAARLTSV